MALLALMILSDQTAYGLTHSIKTHKTEIIKYGLKKLAVSSSLKGLSKSKTSCIADSLGCFKNEWLPHKARIGAMDKVHWRKICKLKISLCKKKYVNDLGINKIQ